MEDSPKGYDREFTFRVSNRVRRRFGYCHDRGEVTRFVVQLEYRLNDEWVEVVRYDHDQRGEQAHDVTDEGLHIDVYRRGEKVTTEYVTPPTSAGIALDHAEDHLSENLERFIERFERWHGIRNDGP